MILRIITGIIGIVIAAVVIQFGGAPFTFAAMLLALAAWIEYSSAFERAGIYTTRILGGVLLILLLCCAWLGNVEEVLACLVLGTLAIFLFTVIGGSSPTDACVSASGVMYIGMPFAYLILLRFFTEKNNLPDTFESLADVTALQLGNFDVAQILSAINFETGCALVWVLFICTWASDTFAYFIGSLFGSHKLAPRISPNKTVEGFLGSIVGTTAAAIIFGSLVFNFPLLQMIEAGILLAVAATVGDLVESVIKRFARIKDSGFLIPGHGGVLDRFDSIFFTAPIFYYFAILMLVGK